MNLHADKIIASDGTVVDTANIDNNLLGIQQLTDVAVSSMVDGDSLVWNEVLQKWTNSSYVANTLQSTYGNVSEGINAVNWAGSIRPMNVSFYGGKAWAEILFSEDTDVGAPWNSNWINSTNNYLQSYNLTSTDGLEYSLGNSSVLVAPEVCTNLLITAKANKLDGINSATMLNCSHMSSADRNKFLDFFTGNIAGFELLNSFAIGGGAGLYDTHLGFRSGVIQTDEFYIMDTIEGSSIGAPRWGYRSAGSNKSAVANGNPISSTNVLSIWMTNY